MFSPKSNIPYKLIFYEMNYGIIVESHIMITFTEQNNIYQSERYNGFKQYEGYDNQKYRFICYLDDNYCFLNSEADATYGKINSFNISKIYLENEMVFKSK